MASEDEFFDEDITIEDTNADNFDFEAPPPPKKGPKIKFVPYDKKPEPKFAINPVYPEIAKEAGIEGTVYIEAGIDEKGNVVQAAVLKGVPNTGLDEAALEAVLRSKWRPARQRDKTQSQLSFNSTRLNYFFKLSLIYSLLRIDIFSMEISFGHSASHAPVLEHAPNPSLSIVSTIRRTLSFSTLPWGKREN